MQSKLTYTCKVTKVEAGSDKIIREGDQIDIELTLSNTKQSSVQIKSILIDVSARCQVNSKDLQIITNPSAMNANLVDDSSLYLLTHRGTYESAGQDGIKFEISCKTKDDMDIKSGSSILVKLSNIRVNEFSKEIWQAMSSKPSVTIKLLPNGVEDGSVLVEIAAKQFNFFWFRLMKDGLNCEPSRNGKINLPPFQKNQMGFQMKWHVNLMPETKLFLFWRKQNREQILNKDVTSDGDLGAYPNQTDLVLELPSGDSTFELQASQLGNLLGKKEITVHRWVCRIHDFGAYTNFDKSQFPLSCIGNASKFKLTWHAEEFDWSDACKFQLTNDYFLPEKNFPHTTNTCNYDSLGLTEDIINKRGFITYTLSLKYNGFTFDEKSVKLETVSILEFYVNQNPVGRNQQFSLFWKRNPLEAYDSRTLFIWYYNIETVFKMEPPLYSQLTFLTPPEMTEVNGNKFPGQPLSNILEFDSGEESQKIDVTTTFKLTINEYRHEPLNWLPISEKTCTVNVL